MMPALSSCPGQAPTQDARRLAVGNVIAVGPDFRGDLLGRIDRHRGESLHSILMHAEQHRESVRHWFELWNVLPEPPAQAIAARTTARLREHYAEHQRRLEEATGVRVPVG